MMAFTSVEAIVFEIFYLVFQHTVLIESIC